MGGALDNYTVTHLPTTNSIFKVDLVVRQKYEYIYLFVFIDGPKYFARWEIQFQSKSMLSNV